MNAQLQFDNKACQGQSFMNPIPATVLQRKCACGNHTPSGSECTECSKNKQALQRASLFSHGGGIAVGDAEVSSLVHESPRFAQDFSHITSATGTDSFDGPVEEEEESVNLRLPSTPQTPTAAQSIPSCPIATTVDDVTDLTPTSLQAGFLSAHGIIARMRVLPDRTAWDGKQIRESLTQTSSTCPAGLTRGGPCSGNSTFTVGAASGRSGVIPQQPAIRNCFYDFHTSHSRSISFLHDAGRNPLGINSCEAVCRQEYSCNNTVIGEHTVTRRFRKGSFNGRNVTIIDVSKTDNPTRPGDFPTRTLPPGEQYASLTSGQRKTE